MDSRERGGRVHSTFTEPGRSAFLRAQILLCGGSHSLKKPSDKPIHHKHHHRHYHQDQHQQPSAVLLFIECLLLSCVIARQKCSFSELMGRLRMAAHRRRLWRLTKKLKKKSAAANCHQGYCFVVVPTAAADVDDDAADAASLHC